MSGADAAENTAIGFSGLTTLATTISPESSASLHEPSQISSPASGHTPASSLEATAPSPPAPHVPNGGRSKSAEPKPSPAVTPSFWTPGRLWGGSLIAFIAFIGLLQLANEEGKSPVQTSPGPYNPPQSYSQPSDTMNRPSDTSSQASQDIYYEAKPAAGNSLVLARNEIRYCLAERVRLEAIGEYLNPSKNFHINSYNGLVMDYNIRCSSYRFMQLDMDAAKASVDALKDSLRAEAAATVRQWR